MARTLVIDTTSTDEFYSGDCNYAVIELAPGFLTQLKQRVELALAAFRADTSFYEMAFWCYAHAFIRTYDDMPEEGRYAEVAHRPNLPDSEIEIPFLYVRCNGPRERTPEVEIVFSGSPKDMSVVVESWPVPLSVFFPEEPCPSTT